MWYIFAALFQCSKNMKSKHYFSLFIFSHFTLNPQEIIKQHSGASIGIGLNNAWWIHYFNFCPSPHFIKRNIKQFRNSVSYFFTALQIFFFFFQENGHAPWVCKHITAWVSLGSGGKGKFSHCTEISWGETQKWILDHVTDQINHFLYTVNKQEID